MLDRKPEPKRRTKSDGPSERMLSSSKAKSIRSFLNVNPEQQFEVVRGLASPVRVRILKLLRRRGPLNINQISEALGMPQSTIATNIQILEESDLIDTEIGRARKGQQKICAARFDEIVIRLDGEETSREKDIIESKCRSDSIRATTCRHRAAFVRPRESWACSTCPICFSIPAGSRPR